MNVQNNSSQLEGVRQCDQQAGAHFHALAQRLGTDVHSLQFAVQLLRCFKPTFGQRLVCFRFNDGGQSIEFIRPVIVLGAARRNEGGLQQEM